jgi:Cu(I)-responsive transcriptional regulator
LTFQQVEPLERFGTPDQGGQDMNIGEAADTTGLPAKTIRYYEDIGLIKPARAANGYRDYDDKDVHRLAFIQRSRSLGFTIDECRSLLSLYEDKERASSDVKLMAMGKIREIDRKLRELQSLRGTLKMLADHCHGDDRPDCPIINEIAGDKQA